MQTTLDGLLDRRVTLEQPAAGYRVAVDTVMLAAAVPAKGGEHALDLGCGVGGAMLCLACRVSGLSITGIEIQGELARLCENNIARNKFDAKLSVHEGDATQLPQNFMGAFDQVLMNPPYHAEARHDVSPDAQKRTANTEKSGELASWIASAASALKSSGTITLIHRADRSDEILALLTVNFASIEIVPLLPKINAKPARIILRARKAATPAVTHCLPLILHGENGTYTDAAESILRHGKPLEFVP